MDKTPLNPEQLSEITQSTIGHYNERAVDFWQGTRDHDVSQNVHALLSAISAPPPFQILDFGCGPGRDLITFRQAGHHPTGLDGAPHFCEMAREVSGCDVWNQDFLDLNLPKTFFHGVFANATLFHIPAQELDRVLHQLRDCLVPDGVLFSSNPRGPNVEGWNGERYGSYHDYATWKAYMERAGFTEIGHYYRPPGRPRAEQPWLASTWRRAD